MRSLQKAFIGAAVVLIPTGVIGATRVLAFLQAVRRPAPILSAAPTTLPSPAIDASRKTVAILLGDVSEVTDILGPYEMFARAGEFNVLTVAVDRRPVRLTSGLAVMPHMTLAELEESLGVTAPDVVVVPHIPNIDRAVNRPLLDVMRRWSAESSLMLSWCTGAGALAESGVLDGRRATAHWGDIDRLQRKYPNVKWQRGVRWVDEESVVASAGLTSGIDATLRVIRRLAGEESALRVARELHYPNYHYSLEPAAPQYTARLSDAVFLANVAIRPWRQRIGLAIFDGVGELDLSQVYDANAGSGAAVVVSVGSGPQPVRSAHGLWLIPDVTVDSPALHRLDRLLVTGRELGSHALRLIDAVRKAATAMPVTELQAGDDRFGLEPVLEDLARTSDVASAVFALRRLEYRSESIIVSGRPIPWSIFALPILFMTVGAALLFGSRMQRAWRLTVAALLVIVGTPFLARAQTPLKTGSRVRFDLGTSERDLLGRPRTQSIAGTFAGRHNDEWLLVVRDGADTLRVPTASLNQVLVSHGKPARWLSALQSAITSSIVSGTLNALVLSIRRRDGDQSPWEGFVDAAKSTAPLTAGVGFLFPAERWRKP